MTGRRLPAALASRDFRMLLSGRVVDMAGNAMAPVALAFAVIDLTGSAADLGVVLAARSVANVALVMFGGVLADRWRRSTVLVGSNILSAASQGTLAVLIITGTATLPMLAGLSVLSGAASAASLPAASALVPQTVPAAELGQANALTRLGSNGAAMSGAALAGLIVAVAGPGWGLAVDATSFAAAGLLYHGVRIDLPPRTQPSTMWADLRDGWHAFTSQTWIWVVVLVFGAINAVFNGAVNVLGPLVADTTVGRATWGLVLSALTGGMVLGAAIAMRWQPHRPLRVGLLCSIGPATLPLTLAVAPTPVALLAAAVLTGICMETFAVAWDVSLQAHVPTDRLARVYAYDILGSMVAIPIGQSTAGPLAETIGTNTVLIAAATTIAAAAIAGLANPDVRNLLRRRTHSDDATDSATSLTEAPTTR